MKDENDAIPEDTVQIPRMCGACYYWKPTPTQAANNSEVPGAPTRDDETQPVDGLCFFNPPFAFLASQPHPLTNQPMMGTVTVRPGVKSTEPACGHWCPSTVDPLAEFDDTEDPGSREGYIA